MTEVSPLNERSRALIIDVARALQIHFPEITDGWRAQLAAEYGFDPRTQAALKRLTIDTGCSYFCQGEFAPFFENVSYYSRRLAKLGIDTRAVARSLDIHQSFCEPHLDRIFASRKTEAMAALDMLRSATFVYVSGAYFDEKNAESAALLSILEAELSAGSLAALLNRALEVSAQTFGASTGALLLKDSEGRRLGLQAGIGLDVEDYGLTIAVGDGFTGGIAASGTPELVLDTRFDERVVSRSMRNLSASLWGVPLVTSSSGVLGVLIIGFSKPYYEWLPKERDLLKSLADRSALAIERARMTEALREREAVIAELSAHLLRAQEEERKHISRELHDDTGQGMMVIRLYLSMLEKTVQAPAARDKLRETLEVVDRTVVGLRRIIARLSPLVLKELGLAAAVRKEAKETTKATGIHVRVTFDDSVGRLTPAKETAIYRVVQEALHNVAKHANAEVATIHIAREQDQVRLVIADDGVGMGVAMAARPGAGGNSFGLAGIRERVAAFGGSVRICSTKGQGTRLEVVVPAAEEQPAMQGSKSAGGESAGPEGGSRAMLAHSAENGRPPALMQD
ncbi:MAG: GAF domain-containing sensor histidine kinase [Acidobacteria bacterium]|nr:GAF domain-containing sensor histidine kinase [Acidobacteriota bacterium]